MIDIRSIRWPEVTDVKKWLRLDDNVDDSVLSDAVDAAKYAMAQHLVFPDDGVLPGDLRQAFMLRVQRYMARRNSPEGVAGFADFGAVRVSSDDPDIVRLEGPYRTVPVA